LAKSRFPGGLAGFTNRGKVRGFMDSDRRKKTPPDDPAYSVPSERELTVLCQVIPHILTRDEVPSELTDSEVLEWIAFSPGYIGHYLIADRVAEWAWRARENPDDKEAPLLLKRMCKALATGEILSRGGQEKFGPSDVRYIAMCLRLAHDCIVPWFQAWKKEQVKMDLRGREKSFAAHVSESVPPHMKSFGNSERKWGAVFYDQLMKGGCEEYASETARKKHVKSLLNFLMEKTILDVPGNTEALTITKHIKKQYIKQAKELAYSAEYSMRYGKIVFGKLANDKAQPFLLL
jgi:hypothetical protein